MRPVKRELLAAPVSLNTVQSQGCRSTQLRSLSSGSDVPNTLPTRKGTSVFRKIVGEGVKENRMVEELEISVRLTDHSTRKTNS